MEAWYRDVKQQLMRQVGSDGDITVEMVQQFMEMLRRGEDQHVRLSTPGLYRNHSDLPERPKKESSNAPHGDLARLAIENCRCNELVFIVGPREDDKDSSWISDMDATREKVGCIVEIDHSSKLIKVRVSDAQTSLVQFWWYSISSLREVPYAIERDYGIGISSPPDARANIADRSAALLPMLARRSILSMLKNADSSVFERVLSSTDLDICSCLELIVDDVPVHSLLPSVQCPQHLKSLHDLLERSSKEDQRAMLSTFKDTFESQVQQSIHSCAHAIAVPVTELLPMKTPHQFFLKNRTSGILISTSKSWLDLSPQGSAARVSIYQDSYCVDRKRTIALARPSVPAAMSPFVVSQDRIWIQVEGKESPELDKVSESIALYIFPVPFSLIYSLCLAQFAFDSMDRNKLEWPEDTGFAIFSSLVSTLSQTAATLPEILQSAVINTLCRSIEYVGSRAFAAKHVELIEWMASFAKQICQKEKSAAKREKRAFVASSYLQSFAELLTTLQLREHESHAHDSGVDDAWAIALAAGQHTSGAEVSSKLDLCADESKDATVVTPTAPTRDQEGDVDSDLALALALSAEATVEPAEPVEEHAGEAAKQESDDATPETVLEPPEQSSEIGVSAAGGQKEETSRTLKEVLWPEWTRELASLVHALRCIGPDRGELQLPIKLRELAERDLAQHKADDRTIVVTGFPSTFGSDATALLTTQLCDWLSSAHVSVIGGHIKVLHLDATDARVLGFSQFALLQVPTVEALSMVAPELDAVFRTPASADQAPGSVKNCTLKLQSWKSILEEESLWIPMLRAILQFEVKRALSHKSMRPVDEVLFKVLHGGNATPAADVPISQMLRQSTVDLLLESPGHFTMDDRVRVARDLLAANGFDIWLQQHRFTAANEQENIPSPWTYAEDRFLTEYVNETAAELGLGTKHLEASHLVHAASPLLTPTLQGLAGNEYQFLGKLKGRSIADIRLRFTMLKHVQLLTQSLLPLIDLTNGRNSMAHHISKCQEIFNRDVKLRFVKTVLELTGVDSATPPHLTIDPKTAEDFGESVAEAERLNKSIFGQGFHAMRNIPSSQLRPRRTNSDSGKESFAFHVELKDTAAEGHGGPYRLFFSASVSELQARNSKQAASPLLHPVPNSKAQAHDDSVRFRDTFIATPSSRLPQHLMLYHHLGRVIGCALRTRIKLNFICPPSFWKQILEIPLVFRDLEDIDVVCCQTYNYIRNNVDDGADVDTFESMFGFLNESQGISLSDGSLMPGSHVPKLTFENRIHVVDMFVQARLLESSTQMDAIRRGLVEIVPEPVLTLLTPRDLEHFVCGAQNIDITALKNHTVHEEGCEPYQPHTQYFWRCLHGMSQLDRRRFIQFAYASDRLPSGDGWNDGDIKMTLRKKKLLRSDGSEMENPTAPPSAQTCFFQVSLPAYTSMEATREGLYAALSVETMDADTHS